MTLEEVIYDGDEDDKLAHVKYDGDEDKDKEMGDDNKDDDGEI